ncbi:unnamed protein product [Miscanthus lutarioriparius]|uniref:FORGETTER1 first zinc ribbon domain-containing protein n=1 Tax=Miscanthus lutarioriparius TaxID=422564 RepID=A0A811R789_9POAL|nr:unnamed protein product [Miscanthus lutarioriparius]
MATPPPLAVDVRCAGCGETLEVENGTTDFARPGCGAAQRLPPELMPPPPRPRRAIPLPAAAGRAAAAAHDRPRAVRLHRCPTHRAAGAWRLRLPNLRRQRPPEPQDLSETAGCSEHVPPSDDMDAEDASPTKMKDPETGLWFTPQEYQVFAKLRTRTFEHTKEDYPGLRRDMHQFTHQLGEMRVEQQATCVTANSSRPGSVSKPTTGELSGRTTGWIHRIHHNHEQKDKLGGGSLPH